MTLYEIADTYQRFFDAVEEEEIPEEAIADTLEAIDGDFEDKADNIACLIKEFLTLSSAQKAEAEVLTSKANTNLNRAKRLREYLLKCMQQTGKRRVETSRNQISIVKGRASLQVDDGAFISWAQKVGRDDLLNYKDPIPSKTAIKLAIDSGEKIPFAEMIEGAEGVRIK